MSGREAGARNDLTIAVRVVPRAGADRVLGLELDAAGRPCLKVAVTAPPAEGAANEAVIALLARRWRVPKNAVSLIAGATARSKRLRVTADAAATARIAEDWPPARG